MYGQLISSVTVGAGGAASIDFTSIPGSFTDVVVMLSARASSTDGTLQIKFNGSSTGYTAKWLYGSGTSVGSLNQTSPYFGQVNYSTQTANTFGNASIYIPNYSGSTNKSLSVETVDENNGTVANQSIVAGLWSNTAAITSISISTPFGGNIAQYSTATLYGLTKGSGGATVS